MDSRWAYETLKIPTNSSIGEIKRAFRRLSLKCLPDNEHSDDGETFPKIQSAYDFLIDIKKSAVSETVVVEKELFLTLEEILRGCEKTFTFTRLRFSSNQTKKNEQKCLTIKVLPGTLANTRFTFREEGDQRNPNGPKADLVYVTRDQPNATFCRDGADVIYTVPVTKHELSHGCRLTIPSIDSGQSFKWTIDGPVNREGFRIVKQGLPRSTDATKRGDLVVHFECLTQDEPVERELSLRLEEVNSGCEKKFKISREVQDPFTGTVRSEQKTIQITIKPGVKNGTQFTYHRMGDQNTGFIPADVIFTVKLVPHKLYQRKGIHLEYVTNVTSQQLEVEDEVSIPTIDGSFQIIKLNQKLRLTKEKRLYGFGLPHEDDPDIRGNLLVKFNIVEIKPKKTLKIESIHSDELISNNLASESISSDKLETNFNKDSLDSILKNITKNHNTSNTNTLLVEKSATSIPSSNNNHYNFVNMTINQLFNPSRPPFSGHQSSCRCDSSNCGDRRCGCRKSGVACNASCHKHQFVTCFNQCGGGGGGGGASSPQARLPFGQSSSVDWPQALVATLPSPSSLSVSPLRSFGGGSSCNCQVTKCADGRCGCRKRGTACSSACHSNFSSCFN